MKFNLQNVGLAVAVLAVVYMATKSKKAVPAAAGSKSEPITAAAQWWSYAGSWQ